MSPVTANDTCALVCDEHFMCTVASNDRLQARLARAGLNDGLFSETMDFRDFPSVLSPVRIAQS